MTVKRDTETRLRRAESDAIRRVAAGEPLWETLDAFAELACRALDGSGLMICLHDAADQRVRPKVSYGLSPELVEAIDECLTHEDSYHLRTWAIGGERRALSPLDAHVSETVRRLAADVGISACAFEPVVSRSGQPVGSMCLYTTDHETREIPTEAAARLSRIVAIVVELERAGRSAREADSQLKALLDAAVNAIVVIDRSGIIEVVNKATESLFGYSTSELIGQNVSVLMPQPYRAHHDQYIGSYLDTGQRKIIGIGREVSAQKKDGTVFPVELSVGEASPTGEGQRFVGIIRDISLRVQMEQEARQNRERLAHVTRLTMAGEMATGIAHEINQPLTAIASYAQACGRLLKERGEHEEDIRDALEQISRQAMRAGEVIRRLRGFVRKRESRRTPCDIDALVKDIVRLVEVDVKLHGIKVELALDGSLPPVLADAIQVQQVLLNLIRNALEAMEEAGAADEAIRVSTSSNGSMVEVAVKDTGVGLTAESEVGLFSPFHSTKSTGMGMGLSISRSIVVSHGGQMWFTRNEGRGATFHFSLPTVGGHDPIEGVSHE